MREAACLAARGADRQLVAAMTFGGVLPGQAVLLALVARRVGHRGTHSIEEGSDLLLRLACCACSAVPSQRARV